MKKIASYITMLAVGAAMVLGASGCDDNFTRPPMIVPTTDLKPNVSILDLKTRYWQSDRNYVTTPGYYNRDEGTHIVIRGRVISSGESGNIYNNIVIADETAAITIAVRSADLTQTYLYGQNVCVDVTGLQLGGYNGLMQLGAEGTYNGAPSMTFMAAATLEEHSGADGLPDAAAVDTLLVNAADLAQMKGSTDELIKWQSQIVRLDGMSFEKSGVPFNNSDKTVDCYVRDAEGNRLNLRISNYADFARDIVPSGTGSVVGILSYYGTDWQLLLIDKAGVIGFDETAAPENPDTPSNPEGLGDGTEEKPYTADQVLNGATGTDVWVRGYIVGFIPDKSLSEAKFEAPATAATNIIIADNPECKDVNMVVPVQLPQGDVRGKLNLQDHPENLGKLVDLKGSLESYFGAKGVKNTSACKIDGDTPDTPGEPAEPVASLNENFDASSSIPAGWTQVQVAGNKSWYVPTFNNNNYAAMTGYKGTAPFDQWLITPAIDITAATEKELTFDTEVNGYGSKTSVFEVYVLTSAEVATAQKTKLDPTIAKAPASGYSDWVNSGKLDLSAFSGTIYIGFRYYATEDANYATWCLDNVVVK